MCVVGVGGGGGGGGWGAVGGEEEGDIVSTLSVRRKNGFRSLSFLQR